MVGRKALRTLPDPLRKVFEANAAYLTEQAITPDLQRNGPSDPDHFLDMDAFGSAYPFATISRVEAENVTRLGKDITAKGRLPWKISEVYRALVQAFRDRDTPRVLAQAGTLCHLIADAHVPLHATDNYDGQLTGQRGLHSRWESDLVERNRLQLEAEVEPAAAQRIGDPVDYTFTVLRDSYLHSLQVLASTGSRSRAGTSRRRRRTTATTTSTSRACTRAKPPGSRPASGPPPPPPARCG
jgi:hypothetical protein